MSNLDKYIENQFNPKRPTGLILALKRNTDNIFDELEKATSFLNSSFPEATVKQRAYHYLNNIDQILHCKYCKDLRQIRPVNARLIGDLFYTATCNKSKCKNRYNYEQTEKGVLKKHGVKNISQTQLWHDKVKATNLERRGVEWATQSKVFLDSFKKNSLRKHGYEHPMQSVDEFNKRMYHYKKYILPSGRIVKVQGYEPQALDKLLETYTEADLIIKDKNIEKEIGPIMYKLDGKARRYYPDIYIRSENKIVEVKSSYTYEADKEKNLAKMNACIEQGFSFEFKIISE